MAQPPKPPHDHKFEIGDVDAITSLIERMEAGASGSTRDRLLKAVRWAEEQARRLECGNASEKDLAFYHGLLTGYAVALKM